jgi:hypothetical protein
LFCFCAREEEEEEVVVECLMIVILQILSCGFFLWEDLVLCIEFMLQCLGFFPFGSSVMFGEQDQILCRIAN